ncbi:MAG: pyridoxal 5'-phosphate synthase glutaminase subunit PdxT [Acidianus infernus]|uniref:pyridoxal 5'-phosphate synthase glutaminase subunit PdxT n=1 Tax=Acidianus infernus TaxID=12915 RepID=UPI0022740821|nr:pyridoxal 5'-phosphate synthase glutaminase subunit PdxT [Acidianus infernus]
MKIGVLAYQGSFEEHALQTKRALDKLKIDGEVIAVKRVNDLDVDGVIIPGGESTTIGIVAQRMGLLEPLKEKIMEGLPVLGTCAGAIMLAKEVSDAKVGKKSQPLIGVMDISVIRNYYGRQRESFEANVDLRSIGGGIEKVVFIRAPAIVKVFGNAKSLSQFKDVHVMVQENNLLATTFHPELSGTTIVHEYFISMIKK